MTASEQLIQLAEEALDGQRIIRLGDSCLVGNEAADQLESFGEAVLPIIQQLILQQVMPHSIQVKDHHELIRRFHGLMSVWVTYFKIAKDSDVEPAVAFLGTLDDKVLATAILGMRSVWWYSEQGKVPDALEAFIHEVAQNSTGYAGEVAKQQLLRGWELKK